MSEPRLAGRKPPAKITWRQARPDDPMFGKIFIVPIQLFVEEEPQNLREAEDLLPPCYDLESSS